MSPEFKEKMSMASDEIDNGDFVTLRRSYEGEYVIDKIMTFSGIELTVKKHASNATSKCRS